MASNGLVVVGAPVADAAFLFVINATSATEGSLVFVADLIPEAGTVSTYFGTDPR